MGTKKRSLQEVAEEYFASISPTARRIMEERAYIKKQFQDEWDEMNHEEREDLIYDYFVSPKLQEKFSSTLKIGGDAQSFPKLIVKSGGRIVEDDAGHSWRDEHSAPFSWETQSQMNFSYIEHNERDSIMEDKKAKRNALRLSKLKSLMSTDTKPSIASPLSDESFCVEEAHVEVSDEEEDEIIIPQTVSDLRNAVKGDVEAVLQKKLKNIELGIDDSDSFNTGNYEESNDSDDDIPKSGFDFLDEW